MGCAGKTERAKKHRDVIIRVRWYEGKSKKLEKAKVIGRIDNRGHRHSRSLFLHTTTHPHDLSLSDFFFFATPFLFSRTTLYNVLYSEFNSMYESTYVPRKFWSYTLWIASYFARVTKSFNSGNKRVPISFLWFFFFFLIKRVSSHVDTIRWCYFIALLSISK